MAPRIFLSIKKDLFHRSLNTFLKQVLFSLDKKGPVSSKFEYFSETGPME